VKKRPFVYSALLLLCICWFGIGAKAQNPASTYFYNPKGITFVPALKKPALIYQGKLFVGSKQLNALFSHLNNEQLNRYFKKYHSNRTAAVITNLAGIGLSLYSLIDWRSNEKKFNWYTFGGGIVLSGMSGYLDLKASENLRNAALVFDEATRKTTFVPKQRSITFTIPLSYGK